MSGLFPDNPPQDDAPPLPAGPGLFGDDPPAVAPVPQAAPYRVLARKYRPANFDDLIGQEAMVRTLRNAFATGRVAHAFMLTGVRGVGKTTTARIIARALNCVGPDGTGGPTIEPCGVCPNCRGILADRHPDVVEMDAASNNGIDEVREIIEAVRFRPMQARTKVFILDEVHMLSKPAFNALLKTLEEPPPHVKFIFATTETRKVPITVLSRCQRFDLRRVRVAELTAHFSRIASAEGITAQPAALDLIARAADGSVRDGLSLLDQAIAQADGEITGEAVADMLGLADREAVFDVLEAVLAGTPAEALAITDRAHERGADLGVLLGDMLELIHVLTRLKSIPGLRNSSELPEAERSRGAAMVALPEHYRWSSVHASLASTVDPILTAHPSYLRADPDPAQRGALHREWLRQGISEDDLHAIRAHLQQERALGSPRFQAMVEKTLNRPVALRDRGRPRKAVVIPQPSE